MGIRQGDVLLVRVAGVPATAVVVEPEGGRLIVARGEATGHHHSFAWGRGATLFRDDGAGSGGRQYVRLDADIPALEHQEHGPLVADPGVYEVRIQRTMRAGFSRRVED